MYSYFGQQCDSSQYAGNTISDNKSNGIHIAYGGGAFIGGNTISGNGMDRYALWGRHGIAVYGANASVVGYNTITGNALSGIFAKSSGVQIGDGGFGLPIGAPGEGPKYANMITGNNTAGTTDNGGIYAYIGASLDIRYATISGNKGDGVILKLRSTARMYGNTINDNSSNGILLVQGGGLRLQGIPENVPPVTATGNGSGFALQCGFGEDSYLGVFAGGSQPVSGSCTGF
jgi:parallel beta-helix repeat protein